MEYIEHGSLHVNLEEALPEVEVQEITRQVAEGLCDLHANNFVHRDLKPAVCLRWGISYPQSRSLSNIAFSQNIMVVQKAPDWWVKIGDFGISKRVHEDTSLRTSVGTRLFMAPETQMIYPPDVDDDLTSNYTERIDVWSLGVVAYYMLFHVYPFTMKNSFLPRYVRGAPLPFPQPLAPVVCDFFEGSLAANAINRLSAKGVLECDWLQQDSSRLSGLTHEMSSLNVQEQDSELSSARPEKDDACTTEEEIKREPPVGTKDSDMTARRSSEVLQEDISTIRYAPKRESTHEKDTSPDVEKNKALGKDSNSPMFPFLTVKPLTRKPDIPKSHEKTKAISRQEIPAPQADQGRIDFQELARGCYNKGVENLQREDFREAEANFQAAVKTCTVMYGARNALTLESQHWLGVVYLNSRDYTAATVQFQEVVRGRQYALGPTHPSTMDSMYELGYSYLQAEEHEKAEKEFRRLLELYDEGQSSEQSKLTLFSLAEVHAAQGQLDKAVKIFETVLEWQKENHGPLHRRTLLTQGRLGIVLMNMEKYERARPFVEENVSGLRKTIGMTASETIFMVHKLGLVLRYLHKSRDAAACFQEVVDDYERGDQTGDDEMYLDSLFNLGRTYWGRKDYKKAESALKNAARGQKASWGLGEKTLETIYRLGRTQYKMKKYRDASVTLRETVDGQTRVLGALDPRTLNSMYWLGYSFRRLKMIRQAEPLFREAFEGQKQVLGFASWDTLESLVALGNVLYLLKQYEEARDRFQEVMEGWTKYYGPTHEDTLYAMSRVGRAAHKAERYGEAETTLKLLVEQRRSLHGSSSSKTLNAMESLGWTLFRMKKYVEGEILMQEVVKKRKKKLNPDAPKTIDAIRALALHLEGQGRKFDAIPLFDKVVLARRKAFGRGDRRTKQSEKEFRRCCANMDSSEDDDSDDTISSISSAGADVGHE